MSTAQGQARIHEIVTEKMIAALKQGVVPWRQTWSGNAQAGFPVSLSSRRPYRGINIWLLGLTAMERGYRSPWWGTYEQIEKLGGQVRKGQTRKNGTGSVGIIGYNSHRREDPLSGEVTFFPSMYFWNVFNAEQADGLPDWCYPTIEDRGGAGVLESAQGVMDGYLQRDGAPKFRYMGDKAHYQPSIDTITIPAPETFESPEARYATEFHEAGHSTGHRSRLSRPGIDGFDHFGSDRYSREELVAEMTSVLLCTHAGICTDAIFDNSAAYVGNWLTALDNDHRLVIKASTAAFAAMEHILGVEHGNG